MLGRLCCSRARLRWREGLDGRCGLDFVTKGINQRHSTRYRLKKDSKSGSRNCIQSSNRYEGIRARAGDRRGEPAVLSHLRFISFAVLNPLAELKQLIDLGIRCTWTAEDYFGKSTRLCSESEWEIDPTAEFPALSLRPQKACQIKLQFSSIKTITDPRGPSCDMGCWDPAPPLPPIESSSSPDTACPQRPRTVEYPW